MGAFTPGGQKRAMDPLQLELQVAMSCRTQGLGLQAPGTPLTVSISLCALIPSHPGQWGHPYLYL